MTDTSSQPRSFPEKLFVLILFIVVITWMTISWLLSRIHTQVTAFQAEVAQEQNTIRNTIREGEKSLDEAETSLKVRHAQKRQNVEDGRERIRQEMKKSEDTFFNEINQEWGIDLSLPE